MKIEIPRNLLISGMVSLQSRRLIIASAEPAKYRLTPQPWDANSLQQPSQRAGQPFQTDKVVTWEERINVR